MSRIHDLIAEHCPGGVEFVTLGEVFLMKAGNTINGFEIVTERSTVAPVPCFGGNGLRGYVRKPSHSGLHLLIGRQGALCGNVRRVRGDFYATEHAIVVSPRIDVCLDWAIHLLTHMNLNQYATRSAQPGLSVKTLERVKIPVPPPAIQYEIAEILDRMELLKAELEAELELRSHQYAYYRRVILDQVQAVTVPLSVLGRWQGGITPSKANHAYWEAGTIPWLASMDVSNTSTDAIRGRITELALNETPLRIVPAPSVAVVMRSNILRRTLPIGLIKVDTTVNQDMRVLVPREGVDAEYVFQALRADSERIRLECVRTDGSMAAVDSRNFFRWEIPLPSLGEQRRVARRLRNFDALVNDLSFGLPAEINARRKQYEYYRDKLLTLPEKAVAV